MSESQQYEVLSIEEVEELRKEIAILTSQIDGTKRKLVMEDKIRDAAQSFNRLDSPANRDNARDAFGRSPKGHRRSILGSRGSLNDMLNKNDDELAASTRRCEGLAQELWKLEKRMQELQQRLLEHTAGVLQKTHTGFLKNETPPHSPDGLAPYGNGLGSRGRLDAIHDFDDRSFYETLDTLLDIRDDALDENNLSQRNATQQHQAVLDAEQRLKNLTSNLKSFILQADSGNNELPESRSREGQDQHAPNTSIQAYLDYLENGLDSVRKDRDHLISRSDFNEQKSGQYETTVMGLWEIIASQQNKTGGQSQQRDSSDSDSSGASSRSIEDFSLQAFSARVQSLFTRLTGLKEQKDILTRQIQQQRELNGKSDAQKDAQISDLSIELENTQKALEEKQQEAKDTRDELVLVTQHLDTARQEATLQEQQRSMTERNALEAEKQARRDVEEQLHAQLHAKQDELQKLEAELSDAKDDSGIAIAAMRAELQESEKRTQESIAQLEAANEAKADQDAVESNLKQQLDTKTNEVVKAHGEMENLESQMVRLHTELTVAKAELDGAYGTRAQRAAEVASNPAVQKELDEITERNKSLLEEITALKTHQETLRSSNSDLSQRAQTLQRELSETIGEYETMTKASIEFEKDREALEASLDTLRDRCEDLENQLGDEKLRSLGVKSPSGPGQRDSQVPGATSASVLKTEFKKMMREMRAENMKALRVSLVVRDLRSGLLNEAQLEQDERRKLEAVIRTLKRDQTPGKSSLSQSMTAH